MLGAPARLPPVLPPHYGRPVPPVVVRLFGPNGNPNVGTVVPLSLVSELMSLGRLVGLLSKVLVIGGRAGEATKVLGGV